MCRRAWNPVVERWCNPRGEPGEYQDHLVDARRSLGLGAHARWLFCDEPSAWSPQAGKRLIDSMRTALGKRKCQIVLCGDGCAISDVRTRRLVA